jgi:hypothetical protein
METNHYAGCPALDGKPVCTCGCGRNPAPSIKRKTIFSEDRKRRYILWREWGCDLFEGDGVERDRGFVQFIGLNPSTANESENDPTIRRCIRFAQYWGFGGLAMTNLFPMVTAYPMELIVARDVVNDETLFSTACRAGKIICCWGNFPIARKTGKSLIQELTAQKWPVFHLGLNDNGSPKHPLYLKASTVPTPFEPLEKLKSSALPSNIEVGRKDAA